MKITFFILYTFILAYLLTMAVKLGDRDGSNHIRYTKKSYKYLIVAYFIFIFLSVFRSIAQGRVGGTDAFGYMNYFNNSPKSLIESIKFQGYEPGYAGFIWLMRLIVSDYKVVLFITHSYMFYSLVHFVKYFNYNKFTILSSFLMIGLLLNSFNIIRMVLAVCISFNVYISLYNKNVLKACVYSLIAISVHISSAILIPIIIKYAFKLYYDDISQHKLVLINIFMYVLAIAAIFTFDFIVIGTKYTYYQGREESLAVVSYIIMILTYIASLLKYNELVKINKMNEIIISAIPIGLMILPLQFKFSIMYRMILFINPLMFMIMPQIIYVTIKNAGYKVVDFFLSLGFSFIVAYKIFQFLIVETHDLGFPFVISLFK